MIGELSARRQLACALPGGNFVPFLQHFYFVAVQKVRHLEGEKASFGKRAAQTGRAVLDLIVHLKDREPGESVRADR